jgi:hypothetical protein
MIELIVEEYCQECPEFSPDIDKDIARAWNNGKMIFNTTVFCKYAYRCKQMEKYFSRRWLESGKE